VIEFTHILCPVDFSESSNRSLPHAAALARWYDAHLTLLHVVPTFDAVPIYDGINIPIAYTNPLSPEDIVAAMRRNLDASAIPPDATLAALAGDTSTVIVERALADQADLIVMGTHGRRGFRRLLLGSVTERVLREAPCPVLTVPPGVSADAQEAVAFKRILCPMDFSPEALHAFEFAVDLARQSDGTVTLFHALEWLADDGPGVPIGVDMAELRRSVFDDAVQKLRALTEGESQTWCEIDPLVTFGRAYREIMRVTEEKSADLIVMGAQGRGGVDLALFGSTTQQVVRGAP
jgi:nucleotide-binding universal stress UspA family protein